MQTQTQTQPKPSKTYPAAKPHITLRETFEVLVYSRTKKGEIESHNMDTYDAALIVFHHFCKKTTDVLLLTKGRVVADGRDNLN